MRNRTSERKKLGQKYRLYLMRLSLHDTAAKVIQKLWQQGRYCDLDLVMSQMRDTELINVTRINFQTPIGA